MDELVTPPSWNHAAKMVRNSALLLLPQLQRKILAVCHNPTLDDNNNNDDDDADDEESKFRDEILSRLLAPLDYK